MNATEVGRGEGCEGSGGTGEEEGGCVVEGEGFEGAMEREGEGDVEEETSAVEEKSGGPQQMGVKIGMWSVADVIRERIEKGLERELVDVEENATVGEVRISFV